MKWQAAHVDRWMVLALTLLALAFGASQSWANTPDRDIFVLVPKNPKPMTPKFIMFKNAIDLAPLEQILGFSAGNSQIYTREEFRKIPHPLPFCFLRGMPKDRLLIASGAKLQLRPRMTNRTTSEGFYELMASIKMSLECRVSLDDPKFVPDRELEYLSQRVFIDQATIE